MILTTQSNVHMSQSSSSLPPQRRKHGNWKIVENSNRGSKRNLKDTTGDINFQCHKFGQQMRIARLIPI
ncbi:hypothetical protein ACLB2K_034558 [Fragaria x ananassa]